MSNIEEELRAAFERQEAVVPEAGSVRSRIDLAWVGVKRRRAKRRAFGAAAAVVLVAAAVPVVTTFAWHGGQPGQEDTVVANSATSAPPLVTDAAPIDVLLIGGDHRAGAKTPRADTIVLLHLPADRSAGWMVSLPRSGLVDVPGKGRQKLATTLALGGEQLTARTVEALTGVDLDAAVVVDYAAWRGITRAVGGIDMCLDQAIPPQDGRAGLAEGCQRIDGDDVSPLLQGQAGLKQASIDRDRNAQRFLAALAKKLAADGTATSPVRINQLLAAAGGGLVYDGNMPMLLRAAAQLKTSELIGLGEPVFTSTADGEIVDSAQWKSLYQAIRDDRLAKWAAANPSFVND